MPLTLSGSALGLGKVIQVVSVTDSTSQSATTSFANTPLTASITPSSTGSRVVCVLTVSMDITQTTTAATLAQFHGQVVYSGGASGTLPVVSRVAYDTRFRGTIFGQSMTGMQTIINVHAPSTTSPITYTFQIKGDSATNCSYTYNNWSNVSGMVLIEVAP